MTYLLAIGAVLLYVLLCAAAGAALFALLRLRAADVEAAAGGPLGAWSTAFALGTGALGAVWTVLALAGRFAGGALAAATVAAALLAALGLRAYVSGLRPAPIRGDRDTRTLMAAVGALMLLYGVRSLGPFLQGDAVAYYMPVARQVALTGQLAPTWVNYAPFFSFGTEAHYAFLWRLGGEPAATLFGFAVAVGAIGAVFGLARSAGLDRFAAEVTAVILLSMGAFQDAVGGGKVDVSSALLGIAAVTLALGAVWHGLPRRLFVAAGLLAGFSVTAKISNALLVPVLGVALAWFWFEKPQARRRLLAGGALFAAAMLGALTVHFAKSWIMLGEPLAPFFALRAWANLPEWASNAPQIVGTIAAQRTISNLDLALLPLTWTFVDRPWMGGNLSPLYLAALVPAVGLRWPSRLKLLAVMAGAAIAAWFMVSPFTIQTRYHFIGLGLLAVPAAYFLGAYARRAASRPWVWAALVMALAIGLVGARKVRHVPALISGRLTRDAYFAKYGSWQAPYAALGAYVREHRQPGERLYLTRSAWYYAYFIDDATAAATQTADEAMRTYRQDWSADAWRATYEAGFRYVMVGKKDLPQGEADPEALTRLPADIKAETVYEDPETTLVKLSPVAVSR